MGFLPDDDRLLRPRADAMSAPLAPPLPTQQQSPMPVAISATPTGIQAPIALPPGPPEPPTGDEQRFQDLLSTHIQSCFAVAKAHKDSYITPILQDCLRRRKGEYDPAILAQIQEAGGTQTYHNLTETKCDALEAWVQDVFLETNDRPWTLTPSPIPTLPPQVLQGIQEAVVDQFLEPYRVMEEQAALLPLAEADNLRRQLAKQVQQAAVQMADQVRKAVDEEAKKRCDELTEAIADLLAEGGWKQAMRGVIHNLATFPMAIIKGPILQGRRRQHWEDGGTASVVDEPILTFSCPSPFDIYPSPSAEFLGDDWLIQRVRFNVGDLETESKASGWIWPRVKQVIDEFIKTNAPPAPPADTQDSTQATLERRPMSPQGFTNKVEALEWWGPVPGKMLLDWAASNKRTLEQFGFKNIREDRWYPITAVYMGSWVVKTGPVLDPQGELPFNGASFSLIPGSLWGKSPAEKLKDVQDSYNSANRAIDNNAAYASRPMIAYDVSGGTPPQRVVPGMVLHYDGALTGGRNPVTFFHPAANVEAFLVISTKRSEEADDRVGIPKYTYGNEQVGGAGETASGLAMLMGQGSKQIKRVIAGIDEDIQCPALSRLIRFSNAYSADPKLKGDVQVQAHGALKTLTKDTAGMRQTEYLGLAASPVFGRFFTDAGIAFTLRLLATRNDLPGDKLVKSDEQIQAEAQAQMLAMAEQQAVETTQAQAGGKPASKPKPASQPNPKEGPTKPQLAQPANQIRPVE